MQLLPFANQIGKQSQIKTTINIRYPYQIQHTNNPKTSKLEVAKISKEKEKYLLFTQKVANLDALVSIGYGRVDGKVSVDEPHFVPVSLGDAGDEILHVTQSGTDGGARLARTEPSFNLELAISGFFVRDELEIEIEVLEVADKLSSRSFNLNDLGVNLDLHPLGDVHCL